VKQTRIVEFLEEGHKAMNIFEVREGFIVHDMIRERTVEAKEFQMNIASNALGTSTLVVLPTGTGKTIIAVLVAAEVLRQKQGKVLMIAPTRPLVEQHLDSFRRFLKIDRIDMFTGGKKPKDRIAVWSGSEVVISTPQTIHNDLVKVRYDLDDTALLIVDEAHRSVGNYAFTGILSLFKGPVLALTASPGGDMERIREVLGNLRTETIEARTQENEDVKGHLKDIEVEWFRTELTDEMRDMKVKLEDFLQERVRKLRKLGFLRTKGAGYVSKKDLLRSRGEISVRYAKNKGLMFGALHNQSQAVIAYHSVELLETQGTHQCLSYLNRVRNDPKQTKAEKGFLRDERVSEVISRLEKYDGTPHPKLDILETIVREKVESGNTVIIFTQIRDTIPLIMDRLAGLRVERFVGQSKGKDGKGMKQADQKTVLDRFRRREFDVLIAMSVSEEGIDIPDVDIVLFYEPIPSEIRTIQRRGRTGRSSEGRVVILTTNGTRDESYLWAENRREKRMRTIISDLSEFG